MHKERMDERSDCEGWKKMKKRERERENEKKRENIHFPTFS
jgi:hypothetical protein